LTPLPFEKYLCGSAVESKKKNT